MRPHGTSALIAAVLLVCFQGCGLTDRGFRFIARYEAPRSGYTIALISKGYVQEGDDLARTAFAVIAFCPTAGSHGRPLRITLTATEGLWIKVDCESLGVVSADLNWISSNQLLTTLLSRAGFDNLTPDEVKGTAKVIVNSLSGPKGVILKGQIKSLEVLQADITYGYDVPKTDPPKTWIRSEEAPSCEQI